MPKPLREQYPATYQSYIDLVPSGELLPALKDNTVDILKLFRTIPSEKITDQQAEDNWSVKDILIHLTDTERILSTKALCIARHDDVTQPDFNEEEYLVHSNTKVSVNDLLEEFQLLRAANILLFKNLPDGSLNTIGTVNGNKASVGAIGFYMVGHAIHHYNILKEKYLA